MALKSSGVTTLGSESNTFRKEYVFTCHTSSVSKPFYRISCTVADMNAINMKTAEEKPKQEDEEDEEEEFVKYGAVDEFYDLEKEIGKGAYGTVKRCTHKTKRNNYAAKIIKTANSTVRKTVLREIEVMRALGTHNKLVKLVDAYQTPFEIVMVLELVEGGELFERIVAEEYLMEEDAVDYVKQILEALQFMHERHVVHLDLKPENILCVSMHSNDIKLVDFGLARSLDSEEEVKSSFGTPDFVAPEVIRMKPVSTASDLWSLGVVTYVLLSGLMPFSGDDDHQTLVKVAKADWDFDDECFDDLSHDAMEFIEGLLVKEPSERLTIEECFQHPWIKDTHDTGTKINTQNHKAFMAKRRWKKSVNALLAVRRMSLSPLFGSKRRRSMDPSILSAASESEEDQHNEADRKVSAPIDPSGLTLPNRRVGETRNSCFNLDMATIKVLQEKAVKATGKASQSDENDNEDGESGTVESIESLELSATCSEEQENEGNTEERDNSVNEEISTLPRRRAHTFCGATFKATPAAASRERKISQISINVGNSSKNDFKPVSFTFNTEDMKRNERVILESAAILNARPKVQAFQQDFTTNDGSVKAGNSMDVSVLTTPGGQFDKSSLKPQTITLEMDNSILTEGLTEPPDNKADELPTICVNDELYVSDPPPIKLALNNNIEKKDQERRASTPPPSLKTNSVVSIANVDKIADSVQAITVQLGNLNGLQLNSKEVTCSVRRASTGSAPC